MESNKLELVFTVEIAKQFHWSEAPVELPSMTRWAYYGIGDGFMRSLLSRWEQRPR